MTGTPEINAAVPPSGTGCVECDAAGGWWVHLRRCAECGHVAAATPRPLSTPRIIGAAPAIRSCRASNPARNGSGTTRRGKRSPARPWHRLPIARSASRSPDRQAACRRTGNSSFIDLPIPSIRDSGRYR